MTTSKRVARVAGKELQSRKSSKKEREVAGAALAQALRKKRADNTKKKAALKRGLGRLKK